MRGLVALLAVTLRRSPSRCARRYHDA